ncbi:MAG: S41 family peptidase, partial [Bacteroidota bacterium]
MIYSRILLVAVTFLFPFFIQHTVAQDCNCAGELNSLIKKTETNYAAYYLNVKDGNRTLYDKLVTTLKEKALHTDFADCYYVLRSYTDFFKDGHLGVAEIPVISPAQTDSLSAFVKKSPLAEPEARKYFTSNRKSLDPAEGIWQHESYTIAITKDRQKNTFTGVVLNSTNKNWKAGSIKLVMRKTEENLYETELWRGDLFKQHTVSSVFKKVLLSAGNMQLAKIFPEEPGLEFINRQNPSLPTFTRLDTDNLLLCMPNFQVDGNYLDSLLKANAKEILSTKNLLIDIRGNQGGNFIYGDLFEYIMDTDTIRTSPCRIVSSPDNISYHEYLFVKPAARANKPVPDYITALLKRMEENPGKIVDYYPFPQYPVEKVTPFPVNVAILTDKANLSASEAFLRYSKQSKKVKQFGTNTKGVLDYMNTSAIPLECAKYYYLYYPVYFDAGLPKTAINNIGIKPDVYSASQANELIQEVIRYYKK